MEKKKAIMELKSSIEALKEFIKASRGEESRCASFNSLGKRTIPPTTDLALYLNSWVLPGMIATLEMLEKKRGEQQ